jgi:hypothetical protein
MKKLASYARLAFRRSVDEIFALPGCYAAYVGSSLRTFRGNLMILRLFSFFPVLLCYPTNFMFSFHNSSICLGRLFSQRTNHRLQHPLYNHASIYSRHSSWIAWALKKGTTGCPETSVKNYKHILHNNSEDFFFAFMWPYIVTYDRASWHMTVHRDIWPCIVTYDRTSWHDLHRDIWPCIVTYDRTSWHMTVHRDIWPCIVTYDRASWHILIIKPTRCANFSNLFWNETLHVSDSSAVDHQEFFTVHSAVVYVIQICGQLSSRIRMEFHPDPASKQSA